MKSVLIIGNGFDLDVGLKTRYVDFALSEYWPFKNAKLYVGCETLAYTLNKKASLEKWFDVEEVLYEYARKGREINLSSMDYPYFESFFRNASSIDNTSSLKQRKITIYTKSDESRIDIECHLHQMVGKDVTLLKNLNDFRIICNN